MSLVLSGAAPAMRRRIPSWRLPPSLLALPLLAFLLIFYAYPLASMLLRSVYDQGWTFSGFAVLATDTVFWRVLGTTAQVAFVVTIACLLLGYPVAYVMSRVRSGTANLLMVLVLIPFWTSILVRTYAWMALLGRRGVVNNALIAMGIVEQPLQLMNTRFAVYLAMVHVLLPFMILPLYAVLRGLDWRLVQAAEGLGAGPIGAFRQVVLPLSLPGIAAGCVLVFTLALGFYITLHADRRPGEPAGLATGFGHGGGAAGHGAGSVCLAGAHGAARPCVSGGALRCPLCAAPSCSA
jgi:putative spermidine/putrescine transport system permease protein